ncbi:MAG: FMN-binding protein [Desulfatiglandales bacterium]
MNQIIRITFGLTISCLIAAVVMGSVFAVTDKAKKRNEHLKVQEAMLKLLGYDKAHPKPADLTLHTFYRYNLEEGEDKYVGYLIPVAEDEKESYELLVIDLEGDFVDRIPLDLSPDTAAEDAERESALKEAVSPPRAFTFADSTIVAKQGGERVAYVIPGQFPGFKTFIEVMLALEPDFDILGLEIMEHEEDPGLGGEIEQDYFKNQFKEKSFERLKTLQVVKQPLPDEFKRVLESAKGKESPMTDTDIREIRNKYKDMDICALTGATISSNAVTLGVKNLVKKFAYRLNTLDAVISAQEVPAVF